MFIELYGQSMNAGILFKEKRLHLTLFLFCHTLSGPQREIQALNLQSKILKIFRILKKIFVCGQHVA